MRWVLSILLCLLFAGAGCLSSVRALDRAEQLFRTGHFRAALNRYLGLSEDKKLSVRITALVGAARSAGRLGDREAQRRYLEAAVKGPEQGGVSEEAFYEYAELLRAEGDRARALNYYYRAAAGAAQYRARGFPYQRASQAIAEINLAP